MLSASPTDHSSSKWHHNLHELQTQVVDFDCEGKQVRYKDPDKVRLGECGLPDCIAFTTAAMAASTCMPAAMAAVMIRLLPPCKASAPDEGRCLHTSISASSKLQLTTSLHTSEGSRCQPPFPPQKNILAEPNQLCCHCSQISTVSAPPGISWLRFTGAESLLWLGKL